MKSGELGDSQVSVLLVDDRPDNLLVLEAILRPQHYHLVKASSGDEALRCLQKHEFAVVLLDIQMPGMDGFETAREIRARESSRNTPIIFVTALSPDPEYVSRAYALGAVDYLLKPVNAAALQSKVAVFVELFRARKKAQDESEARFQLMANTAPVLMWMADPDRRWDWFNQRWLEFTGRRMEDELGFGWAERIHPEDLRACLDTYSLAFELRKSFTIEYRLLRFDGEYRWMAGNGEPRHGSQGEFVGFIGSLIDITERKKAELESARLFEQARKAVQLRDEFLSIASHELRTPITSLQLQLQFARRSIKPEQGLGPTPQQMNRLIEVSERQIKRLTALIEELLDVSRIEAGKMGFSFDQVDLSSLVTDVVERLREQLDVAQCSVSIEAAEPVVAWCDRFRLEQVVVNLLSNAMKYGAGKPVSVSIAGNDGRAAITVQDEGMGIPDDMREKIFERFERAVSASNISGLGLGLYIARQIVDAHHGSIRVESEPGRGSRFIVDLPAASRAEKTMSGA